MISNKENFTRSDLLYWLKCDIERYNCKKSNSHDNIFTTILCFLKHPALFAVAIYRTGFYINYRPKKKNHHKLLSYIIHILQFLTVIFIKIQIDEKAVIGKGIHLSSSGGLILGGTIGSNCTIGKNVTIGMGKDSIPPNIGNNVQIGNNSLIYGEIKIADNVIIKDNTILSRNILKECIIAGNPARIQKA